MRFIKRYFKGWNWFEITFLIGSITIPLIIGIIFKSSGLEIATTVFTLLVSLFFAKAKIEGYFLSFVSLPLYILVSLQAKFYGEVIICAVILFPVAIYGTANWLRNKLTDKKKGQVIRVSHTSWRELTLVILSQSIMFVGYFFLLKAFNTAYLIVSTISVTTSVIAAYLVARRSQLGLLGYVFNDIVVIILWALVVASGSTNSIVILVMPCMYLINDIYGTFAWLKLRKRQTTQVSDTGNL